MPPDWCSSFRGWMRRALALAEQGRADVAPNPMVGAVLLRNGRLVSEGRHQRFGGPHAEVDCLRGLGAAETLGADLVLNLEPCCHTGRTPPCTDLILRSGIRRVITAMEDPNPLVAGKGLRRLREAGVEVACGLLEREARELNRHFIRSMESGRPWITLKWAQSLDGRISAKAGMRTALSGADSRDELLRLRAAHPGILIGIGTVLADNPSLGLDHFAGRNPVRLILDSSARLPLNSRLVANAAANPVVLYCGSATTPRKRRSLERFGVVVRHFPAEAHPPLREVLHHALSLGLDGILVEGGASVHGSFLKQSLCDELVIISAPRLVGSGVPALAMPEGHSRAQVWRPRSQRQVGDDVWQVWRPVSTSGS